MQFLTSVFVSVSSTIDLKYSGEYTDGIRDSSEWVEPLESFEEWSQ